MTYPWHETSWQRFSEQKKRQRLPHAIIISGPKGLAKNALAHRMAMLALCEDSHKQDEPCGKCHSCQLMQTGNHPDHTVVEPEEAGKSIKIEQIRELKNKQSLTPHVGQWKTVIISPANAMNNNANNSLLKLLEEPQANSLIMLISDQASLLPITILSRCQRMNIQAPPRPEAINWVSEQATQSVDQAEWALQLAKGAPIQALALIEQGTLEELKQVQNDFSNILSGQVNPIALAQQWQNHDLQLVFNYLQRQLQHRIRTSTEKVRPNAHYWQIYDCILKVIKLLSSSSNINKILLIEQFIVMNPKKGILSLKITDDNLLYHAYMPFLKNGGLFIPTNKVYALGEEVFILLTLMNEADKIPVAGNIAWITPKGAQNNQAAGIGVHFSDMDGSANTVKNKIENYLAEKLNSDKPTNTM